MVINSSNGKKLDSIYEIEPIFFLVVSFRFSFTIRRYEK